MPSVSSPDDAAATPFGVARETPESSLVTGMSSSSAMASGGAASNASDPGSIWGGAEVGGGGAPAGIGGGDAGSVVAAEVVAVDAGAPPAAWRREGSCGTFDGGGAVGIADEGRGLGNIEASSLDASVLAACAGGLAGTAAASG